MKAFADSHLHIHHIEPEAMDSYLDDLSTTGLTDASLLSLVCYKGYDIAQNVAFLWAKERYKKIRLRAYGCLHEIDRYADIPYEKQTEALLDMGCDGMKFLHMKPDVRKQLGKGVNHPDYDKAFSLMEERGTPVNIHSGDPANFWEGNGCYADGSFVSSQGIYDEVFAMLKKHPRLNLTLAHFFFLSEHIDEARRVLETYPNVKFDLTPGWEMYINFSRNIDAWHDFFETYSDRLLFGTDGHNGKGNSKELNRLVYSAITHDKSEFDMPAFSGKVIRGLALSEKAVENICYANYFREVGETPAPVDRSLLAKAAKRLYHDIFYGSEKEQEKAWLKQLF